MSEKGTRAALFAGLFVGLSCAGAPPRSVAPPAPRAPESRAAAPPSPRGVVDPVVLVTIDGARWQEVFDGTDVALSHGRRRTARELVPNLDRMARERGAAVGAPGRGFIRATGPSFVSLPGYTEILTGRAPIGCQDNTCAPVTQPTLLDDARAAGATVAAFGSWEMLDRAVSSRPGTFFVSCGRAGDARIDPWPGSGDFRPDRLTADAALGYLESARPDVLYVGLGEPDEYGHHDDYAGYLKALTYADSVVGRIFDALDRMGPRGARTHVFVTADHGRARGFKEHGGRYPESARVWLFAAGPRVAAHGRVAWPVERHLADLAPTLRVVLGLEPELMDRDRERRIDRERGMRGEALTELLVAAPSREREAQAFAIPTGHETPSPPTPQ